jgi:type IV secretion system protein VirB9
MASVALAIALASLGGTRNAAAETVPPRGVVDPRVRVVTYNPEDVIKLHGYVGYQIHVQWADGEEFVNLGAGDVGGLDVGAEKNHFFLKPRQEKVGTNLTILTNVRTYHFDYTVSKSPPNTLATKDMVYSIRFTYPQDEARRGAADLARQRTEARLAQTAAMRTKNLDYWYCGTSSLKPISAYDDGVQTPPEVRGTCRIPGDLRQERRPERVAVELQRRPGRGRDPSGGTPVHSSPRPARRLCRQSGLRGRWRAPEVEHHRARRAA